jgi:hypothetical protein
VDEKITAGKPVELAWIDLSAVFSGRGAILRRGLTLARVLHKDRYQRQNKILRGAVDNMSIEKKSLISTLKSTKKANLASGTPEVHGKNMTSAKNLSSKNLSSKNLSSKNLSSKNLSSKNLSSKNLSAKNISAKNISARKI